MSEEPIGTDVATRAMTTWRLLVIGAVGAVAVFALGFVVGRSTTRTEAAQELDLVEPVSTESHEVISTTSTTTFVASTTTTSPTTTSTTTSTTTTTRPPRIWAPSDFSVELIVTESKCFNSAGGLVTVEPSLTILGSAEWDQAAAIVYEVHGGEHVETFSVELDEDGQYTYRPERIDTPTCSDELTAEVVRVIER